MNLGGGGGEITVVYTNLGGDGGLQYCTGGGGGGGGLQYCTCGGGGGDGGGGGGSCWLQGFTHGHSPHFMLRSGIS
ncbi:hypothetical protein CASFOL_015360 [Castilleja foliolosa]|uniref:Uncharacterized protein n=1 Tax=Castilleja foliolosa TaxID=1961234 RepID=A0ABD3DED2_9LAMI